MFIVKFTDSPFYRAPHYLDASGPMRIVQRSRKRATRYATREEAERATRGSWPNGWQPSVEPA